MNKLSKKGQISKALSDFVGYGAFVIVFLVFLLLFNLSSTINKIKSPQANEITQANTFSDITARQVLLNFLMSDVYYDKISKTPIKMSDYAILTAYKGLDENSLIKRQLDSYSGAAGNGCYELKLIKSGKNAFQTKKDFSGCKLSPPVTLQIPAQSNEIIEVSFRLGAKI